MKFRSLLFRVKILIRDNWKHLLFFFSIIMLSRVMLYATDRDLPVYFILVGFYATVIPGRFIKKTILKNLLLSISVILYLGTTQIYMYSFQNLIKTAFQFLLLYSFIFPNPIFPIIILAAITYFFSQFGMDDINVKNTVIGVVTQSIGFIALATLIKKLNNDKIKLRQLSITDMLTGLASLSYIMELGRQYIKEEYPITTIVIDLNSFKQINDTYGHSIGNNVLIEVGKFLTEHTKKVKGTVGRLGGDEFVILIKKATVSEVEKFTYSLRKKMNKKKFTLDPEIPPMHISFALGKSSITSLDDNQAITIENLLYNADIDMYYNKYSTNNSNLLSNSDKYDFSKKIHHILNVMAEKDMYTYVHSEHTAHYAILLGKRLGLPENRLYNLFVAGWLHDIGKLIISNNILRKPSRLTDDEYEIMKDHPNNAVNMLLDFSLPEDITNAILHHHEKWDGTGYPKKLAKEQIPLEARILKITDAYTAMIIKRLYRKSLTPNEALAEIERCAGAEFDPEIVKEFVELFNERKANNIDLQVKAWIDELRKSFLNEQNIAESYI